MPIHSQTIFARSSPMTGNALPPWRLVYVAIARNSSNTMISWTINVPIESLQKVLSVSSLSDKSLRTTMVLLKASPAQM
jgi:hypothetical protein